MKIWMTTIPMMGNFLAGRNGANGFMLRERIAKKRARSHQGEKSKPTAAKLERSYLFQYKKMNI
jgi:hypothetical protein